MTHLVIRKAFLLGVIFLGITSCSTSHFRTLISSYSLTKQSYTDVGYSKDVWEIQPLVTFENEVTIKINPFAWKSFTFDKELCSRDSNQFFFMMWSQHDLLFDVANSYFISSKGKEVLIDTVKVAEENQLLYSISGGKLGINLKPSKFTSSELDSLWRSNGYKTMVKDNNRRYLEVNTKSFVGCSSDTYQLYIAFKDINTGSINGYFLYFHPVEYKSFSR
jgi:hypothetical protein